MTNYFNLSSPYTEMADLGMYGYQFTSYYFTGNVLKKMPSINFWVHLPAQTVTKASNSSCESAFAKKWQPTLILQLSV